MLKNYFETHLPNEKAVLLASIFESQNFEAKAKFVEQGKYCNKVAFIESGLARAYYLTGAGNEFTVCFSFDNMMMLDPVAFYTGEKAKLTIEFLEKSVVHITERSKLEDLFNSDPILSSLGRKITERSYVMMLERIMERDTLSAEERYLNLLKNSELFKKIPLKYLASYIGITDSSLSRIRKKIT
ncbi:Crp/Fnr family transcriptional regulator [Spongiimicrobium sp. 3-5]|uniref:Crp/Fnr family transcriptional regulator n=1 Tax=Spongiimicrobium sp. 3-5 TaxID=3332596 RepID=UPI00397FBA7C